ncbi:threonine/homoserine efflux transporter RhtA [Gramella sp. Hel_I_59]|uniref:EamA family transporter n=1 Tax=Gramella sp. Hel_I_59 TaxID=1249978 RepID=UPI001154DCF4|nr:DMT family transporter [Gramella sp. Hel_I_59]TQI70025.1 threonine/homoserine efflux transporter RhtA [Gramella sp. Hel_I_59]
MDKSVLKGSILVALGACSYGMLTTFVKLAYEDGYTSYEVTFSQMALGLLGLLLINLFVRKKDNAETGTSRNRSKLKLIAAGTTLGLTSFFYYLAVKYIPVSIGIVMLMQSVWMGVVLEAIMKRKKPGTKKILAVIAILTGTLLVTNVFKDSFEIDWRGIGWGVLAAMSYTGTIYCSNTVSLEMHSLKRSLWMMLGGFIVVSIITLPYLIVEFNTSIFLNWGLILALFGTILPPLLYTAGMPKIDVGLGAIISSIELPAAVLMAYFLLNEQVDLAQWLGIGLILLAVVQMNLKKSQHAMAKE